MAKVFGRYWLNTKTPRETGAFFLPLSLRSQGELSIVAKENTLTIKGEKTANENGNDNSEVLYRGIAARAFERAFQLADFVQVKNASLENGLLHVDLVREIPEAKKPRSIPINSGAKAPQVVDASVAA